MPVQDDPAPGVPEWVVTYGDMMSLLLTFFIMLVSMSEMKEEGKMRAALDAISEAFGNEQAMMGSPGDSFQTTSVLSKLSSVGNLSLGGTRESALKNRGAAGKYDPVQRIREGTVVTLGGAAMFKPFEAELSNELKRSLDSIADVLRKRSRRIEVRGHAAPTALPKNSKFRDAFDLSFARADAVAKYLISKEIRPSRILVSAAGDNEPRSLRRGSEHQALNRRVDVYLIDSYIERSSKHR
ncbi:Motility protein B [Symmachiella macrocystis]|uniref:Motility protein B n=1 Tax=Symmachiella macrocystis TaxID=2527985 RepID=A0A5C6BQN0_9PLAN|nr:OmpA family protein [Symmachiella macrocystis]TWU12944.1 Motility protein B [Symmachiella macrocystis]